MVPTYYSEGYHAWGLSKAQDLEFLWWFRIRTVDCGPATFATNLTLLLLISSARLCVFAVKERVSKALRWFMTGPAIVYSGMQIPKVMVCTPVSN